MGLINRIQEFGKEKGIPSANKFWQITGLPRATAFRLWRDRSIYPDRGSVEVICKKLNAQPGDFLNYVEEADEIS
ncbi:MAG: XRE family transcriptional regulator [Mastigocladus sp. ERB_26_2]|uniref:helix-turn-helix domain-containing protein n=1 Tax=Fischerella sp. JS2 TaxID=2597771 RepID=UPI0028E360E4|nr:helix-turn-helix transcriptional regulator [Fischerella sp. JS2]